MSKRSPKKTSPTEHKTFDCWTMNRTQQLAFTEDWSKSTPECCQPTVKF